MIESESEFVTLKPRWSVLDLVSERSAATNRNSILVQLHEHYIDKGWLIEGDIVWGKGHKFAVVRLKPPTMN